MAVEGVAGDVAAVPKDIGKGLGHKIGPLPLWGWFLILAGGGIGAYLIYQNYSQAQGGGSSGAASLLSGTPFTGGNGTPATTTTPTTTTPLTNADWVNSIAQKVASATGLSLSDVQFYLNSYLAGTPVVGVPGAVTNFNNVINTALQLGGTPPGGTPQLNVNTNPFSSMATYLNQLLSFLPSGTSPDVITEITNLVNGNTNSISQDAANALAQAQSVVGQGPTPLVYTVQGIVTNAQATAAIALTGASGTLPNATAPTDPFQNFTAWAANIKATVPSLSGASTNDLAYIYNYINQSFAPGGSQQFRVPGTRTVDITKLAAWLSTIVPQLGSLPTVQTLTTYNGTSIINAPLASPGVQQASTSVVTPIGPAR